MSANTFSTFAGDTAPSATVSAAPAASSTPVGSLDDLADYMVNGFWDDLGVSAHKYDTSASNEITVDVTALSKDGKQLARWAFEAWEAVADIEFVEVSSNSAQIVMDEEGLGVFTGYSSINGITQLTEISVSQNWLDAYGTELGSYAFQSYMHEIGHALGLGHTGNYNVTAVYGTDETYSNDSWQLSVMSYFDQQQNTTVDDTRAETGTLMMADIIAIQSIYGAADGNSLTAGNTTYGTNHTLGNSWLGELMDGITGAGSSDFDGSDTSFTIYDRNGYDIIDFSTDTEDQTIDMNDGSISSVFGLDGNMAIARDTVIEEYRAGSGDDSVTGNAAHNVIDGGDGDDDLLGGGGNDTMNGGDGDDYMHGGNKKDTLNGGDGDDEMRGGGARDLVYGDDGNDDMGGGGGADDVHGGDGDDRVVGGNGIDLVTGGMGDDVVKGGGGVDDIRGNDGEDKLAGGNGDDIADGGAGDDNVNGGRGNDIVIGGAGDDVLKGAGGSDSFVFYTGDGSDVIKDFDATDDNEVIDLSGVTGVSGLGDLSIAQDGNDAIITDGAGLEITLRDVDTADLDSNDFLF